MPFIVSICITVNSIDRLKKIIYLFIFLMIFNALYGVFHLGRGTGNYFADENDLSLYVNMWLPVCFFLLFTRNTFLMKIVLFMGLVVGLAGNVVSLSRGGFVSRLRVCYTEALFGDGCPWAVRGT